MKILHTSDWQIGKPFASIDDEHNRTLVRQARLDAIDAIAQRAATESVDAVLVAGDLFDSPSVTQAIVSAACAKIGRIPCPVFAIPGNHDHGGPGSIWEQPFFRREKDKLAPNLHVCLNPTPVDAGAFILFPCPLLHRAETSDTTAWLRDADALDRAASARPRIVLAHGSVQDFSSASTDSDDDSGATNHLSLDRLPWDAIDYAALGDWHGTKQVHPKAWYSGTPEYDRFAKGADYTAGQVLIVEVARGQAPQVNPQSTGTLSWHDQTWEFHSEADLTRFDAWINETFANRAQRDLLKLRLTGALGLVANEQLHHCLESLRARRM